MIKKGLLALTVLSLSLVISSCNKGGTSSVLNSNNSSSETSSSKEESSETTSSSTSNSSKECTDHVFKTETRKATIIEKGASIKICETCGYTEEENEYTYVWSRACTPASVREEPVTVTG